MATGYFKLRLESTNEELWEGNADDIAAAITNARIVGVEIPPGTKLRVSFVTSVEIDKNGNPKK